MVLKDVPGDLPKMDNCMSLCSYKSAMPSVQDKLHLWGLVSRVLGTCRGTHLGTRPYSPALILLNINHSLVFFEALVVWVKEGKPSESKLHCVGVWAAWRDVSVLISIEIIEHNLLFSIFQGIGGVGRRCQSPSCIVLECGLHEGTCLYSPALRLLNIINF